MRFRGQALRSLESPEQLQQVARLAPVPTWLTAVALGLVVMATGGWAVCGTVPMTTKAQGVLTHAAGVSTVDASWSGQVTWVWVRPDQRIERGDPMYTVTAADGTVRTVDSPWSARTVSVLVSEGQWVEPGTDTLTVERLDGEDARLRAVVYVAASAAPSIRRGMAVDLIVDCAPAAVHGTVAGEVAEVGAYPETADSLRAFLGADRDVTPYLSGGAVVRVIVLLNDSMNWSRTPPSFSLSSQSAVTARFTLAHERPADWLLR